ncbi:MAG: hypothetical protein Q4C87_10890 [Actinomycetaceae bacterium]|nr:hypothetical protein [Actinomycetaceae bacterium]
MGILFVTFAAPSDDMAAEVIHWSAGPDVGFPEKGIDLLPSAQSAILGVDLITWFAELPDDTKDQHPSPLALVDEGEMVVDRVPTVARDALAETAVGEPSPEAADILNDLADLEDLRKDNQELLDLAVFAVKKGWQLYYWVSV